MFFFGLKLDGEKRITRVFACGIEDSTPFCIEGHTGINSSIYKKNKRILYTIFGNTYDETTYKGCYISDSDGLSLISCDGNDVGVEYVIENGDTNSIAGTVYTCDSDANYMYFDSDKNLIFNNAG